MVKKIVVRYSEIATKGKNRNLFENCLVKNIKTALGKNINKIYKRYGKIICKINNKSKNIEELLKNIPGIANFSFAVESKLNINEIKNKSLEVAKNKDFKTFKIIASRSYKKFELNSIRVNNMVGEFIIEKLKKKVDMKNPDINIFIEIGEKEAFVYTEKIKGIGGLPVGVSGKIMCSLSGGIDSPVASFLMMKRGCEVVFVHIFNDTQTDILAQEKIKEIVKELTKFQLKSKLYVVPFGKIQKQIIINVPSKFRMIVYRRFMMKIINEIAKKEKAKAIVTGDSVGQVASQTLENLNSIYDAAKFPIFAPLAGMNKEEIINLAKRIKTFDISIKPYPDCCSFMIAQHPETKSNLKTIKEIGIKQSKKLIRDAVKRTKIFQTDVSETSFTLF